MSFTTVIQRCSKSSLLPHRAGKFSEIATWTIQKSWHQFFTPLFVMKFGNLQAFPWHCLKTRQNLKFQESEIIFRRDHRVQIPAGGQVAEQGRIFRRGLQQNMNRLQHLRLNWDTHTHTHHIPKMSILRRTNFTQRKSSDWFRITFAFNYPIQKSSQQSTGPQSQVRYQNDESNQPTMGPHLQLRAPRHQQFTEAFRDASIYEGLCKLLPSP